MDYKDKWQLIESKAFSDFRIVTYLGRKIATVRWDSDYKPSLKETKNAQLIASAPELLYALKEYMAQHERWANQMGHNCDCAACVLASDVVSRINTVPTEPKKSVGP